VRARDLIVAFLKLYQRAISPYLGSCCRFYPSCSEYMIGSIRQNGSLLGVFDGLCRILRCHPFHPGGVDPPRRIHFSGTGVQWKKG
jgi:putative membrane protein insertion efficiency factor